MIMKVKANTASSPGETEDLLDRAKTALESKDQATIAALQLEIQLAMLQYLQRIDWKLWELYNKFGT